MKKVLAVVLAVCMLAAMTMAASAESPITAVGGTDTHNIQGKYVADELAAYYVTVAWDSMKFDFKPTAQEWDHENHLFKATEAGGQWTVAEGSGNAIKVENHSSVPVKAAFSAALNIVPAAGDHSEIGEFSAAEITLVAPARGNPVLPDDAKGSATYMPKGKLDSTINDYSPIGVLTVTINAVG